MRSGRIRWLRRLGGTAKSRAVVYHSKMHLLAQAKGKRTKPSGEKKNYRVVNEEMGCIRKEATDFR